MTITLDRNLTAITNTEVKKQSLIAAPILYLDFPSLEKYFAGSNINITVNSNAVMPSGTYIGVGGISSVSVTEETADLKATNLVVDLNGLDSTYVAMVLAEQYYGRDASMGLAILDSNYKLIGEPVLLFKGFMSKLLIDLEDKAKVSVELESIFMDWERPRVKRYNTTSQATIDGVDAGFNNVAIIINKEVTWG